MKRLMRSMPKKKSLHKDQLKYQEGKSYYKRKILSWRKDSRNQSQRSNYKVEGMNNNSNRVNNKNKMTNRNKP